MIHARCTSCNGLYSIEDHRGYTAATYCPECGARPLELLNSIQMGRILSVDHGRERLDKKRVGLLVPHGGGYAD